MNPDSTQKLISICMLTHNSENTIKEALNSILAQSYKNWELIIVDDVSSDDTISVIESIQDPRIKIFKNETKYTLAENRNLALEKSFGDYVAVLDSDDVWVDSEKLEKQISFLETNPDHVMVGTQAKAIDESGLVLKTIKHNQRDESIRKNILIKNQFTHSSIVVRKESLDSIGGYKIPNEIPIWEDYYMIMELGQKGKLANIKDFSTLYRVHAKNTSKNKLGGKYHLDIIKKFKTVYPNYIPGYIFGLLRIILK